MVAQSQRKIDGGRIPGPAAVPACIEVKMMFQIPNGHIATCTVHGRNLGTFTPSVANANLLFNAIAPAWVSNFNAYSSQNTHFQRVRIRDMSNPTFPEFDSTVAQVSTTSPAAPLPADVALVLTEKGTTRGRGAQGRIYLSGFTTAGDDGNGQIISGLQAAANAWGLAILSMFSNNGMVACIAKPARQEYIGVTGALHPARPAGTVDVASYICQDLEWDTQRRRGN